METVKMEAKAVQRHLRKSPRKVRLVADAVRGERVDKALTKLSFINKDATTDVSKVIRSAAANIRDKFEEQRLDDDQIYIKEIYVDKGVTLKRIQPAPMGRAHRINKRSCHITVVVAELEEEMITEQERG